MTSFGTDQSMLTDKFMYTLLTTAKKNLVRDSYLVPTLFVKVEKSATLLVVTLADMPNDTTQRPRYFQTLRARLRKDVGEIAEAIYLGEMWWAPVTSLHDVGKIAASAHPARQEAIILVGRNAGNSSHALLIQPFGRDSQRRPVWDKVPVESYGQSGAVRAHGVLDTFFDGTR